MKKNHKLRRFLKSCATSQMVTRFVVAGMTILGMTFCYLSYSISIHCQWWSHLLLENGFRTSDTQLKWGSDFFLSIGSTFFTAVPIFILFELIIKRSKDQDKVVQAEKKKLRNKYIRDLTHGGSSEFTVVDDELHRFASKLWHKSDGVCGLLFTYLSPSCQQTIGDYFVGRAKPEELKSALTENLGIIIENRAIHEEPIFQRAAFRQETKDLIENQKLSGEELIRLKCMLLEDAYPLELSRNKEHRQNIINQMKKHDLFGPESVELDGADLSDLDISATDFSNVQLRAARLIRTNANGCDFSKAQLTEANLTSAVLYDTKWIKTPLRSATLTEAKLCGADFYRTMLAGAKANGADFFSAVHLEKAVFRDSSNLPEPTCDCKTVLPNGSRYSLEFGSFSQAVKINPK